MSATNTTDSSYVIGVDIGGTFTDLVLLSAAGGIRHTKARTTPWDFAAGVWDAIGEAAAALDVEPAALLARTTMVKHGSTIATNALITRGGDPVGFITTKGFEDTPYIMRAVGRVDGLHEEEISGTGAGYATAGIEISAVRATRSERWRSRRCRHGRRASGTPPAP